jgi:hypothetical protein
MWDGWPREQAEKAKHAGLQEDRAGRRVQQETLLREQESCHQSDAEQDTGPALAQKTQGLPLAAGKPSPKRPQNTLK